MSLKKQIEDKLNEALKAKDKNIYPTLRLIVSAIKDAEIAGRTKGQKEITDSDIISILKKMIKQRNESCEVYKKAGRTELLENETKELKQKLVRALGKDVDLSIKVDASIIGGIKLRVENTFLDASLKSQIRNIKLDLMKI